MALCWEELQGKRDAHISQPPRQQQRGFPLTQRTPKRRGTWHKNLPCPLQGHPLHSARGGRGFSGPCLHPRPTEAGAGAPPPHLIPPPSPHGPKSRPRLRLAGSAPAALPIGCSGCHSERRRPGEAVRAAGPLFGSGSGGGGTMVSSGRRRPCPALTGPGRARRRGGERLGQLGRGGRPPPFIFWGVLGWGR